MKHSEDMKATIEEVKLIEKKQREEQLNHYQIRYYCENCGQCFNLKFPKGQKAPPQKAKCPNCETMSARKNINVWGSEIGW